MKYSFFFFLQNYLFIRLQNYFLKKQAEDIACFLWLLKNYIQKTTMIYIKYSRKKQLL